MEDNKEGEKLNKSDSYAEEDEDSED